MFSHRWIIYLGAYKILIYFFQDQYQTEQQLHFAIRTDNTDVLIPALTDIK